MKETDALNSLIKERLLGGTTYSENIYRGIGKSNYAWVDEFSNKNFNNFLPRMKRMQKLSPMQKELLNEDTKTLIKAGYLDNDLELTEEGEQVFNAILFEEKRAQLVAAAKAKLDSEVKK